MGIHDSIGLEIDHASIHWGDGVHIKHELMDGIPFFFYERVPDGSRVLDLGCGVGVVAGTVAQYANAEVLGIDMNEDSDSFAKNISPSSTQVCCW